MKYTRKDNSIIEFTTILEDPTQATIFQHFKGKEYKIVTIAKDSDDLKDLVIYQGQYADSPCWVRETEEFFSKVDRNKYKDVEQEYRFQKITLSK